MGVPPDLLKCLSPLSDGLYKVEDSGGRSLLIVDTDVVLLGGAAKGEVVERLRPHVDLLFLLGSEPFSIRGAEEFSRILAPWGEKRALESWESFLPSKGVPPHERSIFSSWRKDFRPLRVERGVRPGSVLLFEHQEWHILPAPGVSPGGVVLLEPNLHILYSGPLTLQGRPWYGWPVSDPWDLDSTLGRLREIPIAEWIPEEGPTLKRGILTAIDSWREKIVEAESRILQRLGEPRTVEELAREGALAGTPPPGGIERFFERTMIEKHVSHLLERGLVRARQDGRYERE